MFSLIKKSASKGFTLIELLVVIGILGVLAAALIATIDPFEQLKKAQDSSMKDLAIEFLNANTRYYANHNALSWFSVANGGANCYTSNTLSSVPLTSLTNCITAMISDGELKQGFSGGQNLNLVLATNPNPQTGGVQDTTVCFLPQSKAQRKDSNSKFTAAGASATNCISQGGSAACYWCAQ
jgi:prepilin-type N-terminal cleavage/methylation domain-containing protein